MGVRLGVAGATRRASIGGWATASRSWWTPGALDALPDALPAGGHVRAARAVSSPDCSGHRGNGMDEPVDGQQVREQHGEGGHHSGIQDHHPVAHHRVAMTASPFRPGRAGIHYACWQAGIAAPPSNARRCPKSSHYGAFSSYRLISFCCHSIILSESQTIKPAWISPCGFLFYLLLSKTIYKSMTYQKGILSSSKSSGSGISTSLEKSSTILMSDSCVSSLTS